jgi:triosephosphate isomerase (TIM)
MPNKRQPLMSGNWKMNLNHYEAIQTMQKLAFLVGKDDFEAVEVSVHPPFTDLRSVQTLIEGDRLGFVLGAQNCHFEDSGAFTGEVSAAFLGKLNVKYVICGHSERRQIFGESDEIVNRKVIAVLKNGMIPIMCVGETLEERESGATLQRVLDQLRGGLASIAPERVADMTIAYEPIWAIGTGKTATAQDAQDVCGAIRRELAVLFGHEVAQLVRIQYGGSVKAGNVAELMAQPDIDGALVGGASLDPDEFARIIQYRLH